MRPALWMTVQYTGNWSYFMQCSFLLTHCNNTVLCAQVVNDCSPLLLPKLLHSFHTVWVLYCTECCGRHHAHIHKAEERATLEKLLPESSVFVDSRESPPCILCFRTGCLFIFQSFCPCVQHDKEDSKWSSQLHKWDLFNSNAQPGMLN